MTTKNVVTVDKLNDSFTIDQTGNIGLHVDNKTIRTNSSNQLESIGFKYFITGVGRPDKPDTTKGKITGSEENGTVYNSTDGGGVNAWQWVKVNDSWQVSNGDTGWIEFKTTLLSKGTIELRRTTTQAYIRITSNYYNGTLLKAKSSTGRIVLTASVPVGFKLKGDIYGVLTEDYLRSVGAFVLSAKNDGNNTIQFRLNETVSSSTLLRPQTLAYLPEDVWVDSLTF